MRASGDQGQRGADEAVPGAADSPARSSEAAGTAQSRGTRCSSLTRLKSMWPRSTLVASSYGMNFEFMPELHWSFGYPGAIVFMILAGLAPYLYFKRKNWL